MLQYRVVEKLCVCVCVCVYGSDLQRETLLPFPAVFYTPLYSPALVGCLWDVTDGEIDRLCQALLKHILGDDHDATPLPSLVAASRTACKLQWLTGASTIVYGTPVTVAAPASLS